MMVEFRLSIRNINPFIRTGLSKRWTNSSRLEFPQENSSGQKLLEPPIGKYIDLLIPRRDCADTDSVTELENADISDADKSEEWREAQSSGKPV